MGDLFDAVDVPELFEEDDQEEEKYRRSVYWDFDTGDFAIDGNRHVRESTGQDAYIQWCAKAIDTERFACLAYPDEIGAEKEAAKKEETQEAVEAAMERTITETLMVNPRTEYVRDFEFRWAADNLYIEFTVKGKPWEEKRLNLTV